MNRGTITAMIFVVLLAALAADMTVGCGQGYVYGPVTQKFSLGGGDHGSEAQIAVNGSPYEVPVPFYLSVQVGDVVKYDGRNWTIVKKANGTTPASTP